MTLYEISEEYRQLYDLCDGADDIDPAVFSDTLESINAELDGKADGYAVVIRQLQADADALKAEISRLAVRKKKAEESIDRMKDALCAAMKAADKPKIKTARFTFNVQKNPPKVVTDDANAIPAEFWIEQEPKLNTAALKIALKNGEVSGAHLEQGEGLRIR